VLTLTRIGSTRVYVAAGPPGFLAFLASGEPPNSDPVSTRTLWEDAAYLGYFSILASQPADLPKFAAALESSDLFPPPEHTSFAWLRYTESTQQIETVNLLAIAGSGAQPTVKGYRAFAFRNYGFAIHDASPVLLLSAGDAFVFQYPPLKDLPAPTTRQLTLSFDGPQRFCFQSEGLIGDFSDATTTGWDVSLRYYSGAEVIRFWRYPVFENPAPGLQHLFRMNWDLLAPLDESRTFLDFTRAAYRLTTSGGPEPVTSITPVETDGTFPSALRTLFGAPIRLLPLLEGPGPAARLVFESVPDSSGRETRFNLVPAGDFAIVLPTPARDKLLCGLCGTEFVTFPESAGATIRFHPRQPAWAPQYPLLNKAGGGSPGDLLDSRFRTAWVSLGGTTLPPVYYSQPVDSALFTTPPSAAEFDGVLSLYDAEVATMALGTPFPMAGYGGMSEAGAESPTDLANFEAQILAPSRYQTIAKSSSPRNAGPDDPADEVTSTTAQGFLATVNKFNWLKVILARTTDPDKNKTQLAFHDLPGPLREAFQSSELFLVISRNQNLGQFDNRIVIADWPFTINLGVESADKFENVLIVKFCSGSVAERARNTASWTNPAAFNTAPGVTAAGITAYIAEAEAQSADVPALKDFVRLVRDPTWNGVLALRIDIELSKFPPDLKGLLGGMDLTRFYGHHLGLTLNFVERGQTLDLLADSSLFALINYRDQYGDPGSGGAPLLPSDFPPMIATPSSTAPESESFNYRVITLLVEFKNSEVTNFESRIILTIARLFGETAALAASPQTVFRNSLVFDGNRQVIDGKPSYSFSTGDEYRFLLTGTVLQYVQVRSAQFLTLSEEAPANGPAGVETIRARFNLEGFLNFHAIPTFDAFSFGDETAGPEKPTTGLQFGNLGVNMQFDLPPGFPLRFQFDPTAMSFDTGRSQARERSVFLKMPLTMSALLTGAADKGVKDLGFVPVRVVELSKNGSIGSEWFGLSFTLNLGTLGALAGSAGFSATLLVAWSAGGPPNPVQLFLNLPGLGTGKKELSLQSVLKLTIASVQMAPLLDGLGQIDAYVLKLGDIGLSLLGKKLPPSGVTDLALFSDFRQQDGGSSLSWYAAYYTKPPAGLTPSREESS
jgi:hypothetical protein